MKKELVVKDNALINASYNLDFVEQRLILLAIIEARQTGTHTDEILTIHADSYVKQFGVHRNTAYKVLKDACNHLFERRFSYQTCSAKGNIENVKSRWVQRISYVENEALVRLQFSADVVPLISNLKQNFTRYELEQISGLNTAYAIRLYELLIAWRTNCQTPIYEMAVFRNRLGVGENEYPRMHDFKKRVVLPALDQINQHTDITARYEQHKQGRTITGFSFQFTFKKPPKARQRRTKAQATQATDPDQQDALSRYNGLKSMAELSGEPLQSLASEQEWVVFQGRGWV